ncbi:MAG: enoyl-CoA hydratase/isomerase family protein [gamma proteobacterium symbiont of Taylorina sp.]|nr:enoyl-CoA hydratase/isomerase family protein [gamma proteobacterium symbiont of Taylorina sp.]
MNDFSNYSSDVFTCSFENQTAVISLKEASYKIAHEVSHVHDLLACINSIEMNQKIKGVLIQHETDNDRIEVLQTFIQSIQKESGYVKKEMGVTRYGNSIKRITLALNDFSKPVVIAISGNVPIDSFGYFLACDYRIATDDMRIEFPGLIIGITPMGAVPFFLKRQLGTTKTMELLMAGKIIPADEAKEMSIVSEVVSQDKLNEACRSKLEEFYQVPGQTLNFTKQLVRPKTFELEEYFEMSSRLIWNSIIDNK